MLNLKTVDSVEEHFKNLEKNQDTEEIMFYLCARSPKAFPRTKAFALFLLWRQKPTPTSDKTR